MEPCTQKHSGLERKRTEDADEEHSGLERKRTEDADEEAETFKKLKPNEDPDASRASSSEEESLSSNDSRGSSSQQPSERSGPRTKQVFRSIGFAARLQRAQFPQGVLAAAVRMAATYSSGEPVKPKLKKKSCRSNICTEGALCLACEDASDSDGSSS